MECRGLLWKANKAVCKKLSLYQAYEDKKSASLAYPPVPQNGGLKGMERCYSHKTGSKLRTYDHISESH